MSEIEILLPNEPVKLNWKIREFTGTEVYGSEPDFRNHNPLTSWPAAGAMVIVFAIGGWIWAQIDEDTLEKFEPEKVLTSNTEDMQRSVTKIIDILNSSDRPVILAGNGIRLAKANQEFLKLIDILKIPVLTTWKSIDLLAEEHPLFFGIRDLLP